MPDAKQILGSKGAKLRAVGMHLRHTDNKKYISTTDHRDKHGNPPSDGQKASTEHSHEDLEAMLEHIRQTMAQQPDEEQQAPSAPPDEPQGV